MTREMTLESLPQLSASFSSCRRPQRENFQQQDVQDALPEIGRFALMFYVLGNRVQHTLAALGKQRERTPVILLCAISEMISETILGTLRSTGTLLSSRETHKIGSLREALEGFRLCAH
jgi:hypothetical protein